MIYLEMINYNHIYLYFQSSLEIILYSFLYLTIVTTISFKEIIWFNAILSYAKNVYKIITFQVTIPIW